MRTAVATFSRRHSVAFVSVVGRCCVIVELLGRVCVIDVNLLRGLVEVLRGVYYGAHGGTVEVIKHQIHILLLLDLQVVSDFDVPVHFDFDVSVSLARQSTWLRELADDLT